MKARHCNVIGVGPCLLDDNDKIICTRDQAAGAYMQHNELTAKVEKLEQENANKEAEGALKFAAHLLAKYRVDAIDESKIFANQLREQAKEQKQ